MHLGGGALSNNEGSRLVPDQLVPKEDARAQDQAFAITACSSFLTVIFSLMPF